MQTPEAADYNGNSTNDNALLYRIELTDLIKAEQLADNPIKQQAFWDKLLKWIDDTATNKPFQGSKTTEDNTGRRANTIAHGWKKETVPPPLVCLRPWEAPSQRQWYPSHDKRDTPKTNNATNPIMARSNVRHHQAPLPKLKA